MVVNAFSSMRGKLTRCAIRNVVAASCVTLLCLEVASAHYVGESYLQVPGVTQGQDYANWLRMESHYWKNDEKNGMSGIGGLRRNFRALYYSGPVGPRDGASQLMVAIDKRHPLLPKIMQSCTQKTAFAELTFVESAARSRGLSELGWQRPEEIPAFFEYRLKDAQITDCPVVGDAPDQAVVISFGDIERLNYKAESDGRELKLEPAVLAPVEFSGKTKTFVVTWLGQANDVSAEQCDRYNAPPSEDDYYALLPKEEAEKERAERSKTGGVSYRDGTMERRGPNRLNAVMLPGIVKDPGQIEPKTKVARGLNLDDDDGTGRPPAGTCKHANFVSEDGRTGIDNQLYRVQGCSSGFQGRKGFLVMYSNEQRRNGTQQMLIQISGIDDESNDASVDITILHSDDPMAKSADGKQILPDYTYRLTKVPQVAHYSQRMRGQIVKGVLVAKPDEPIRMLDFAGHITLQQPALRFEFMSDGSLRGVVGGYMDWRRILMMSGSSNTEYNHGLQIPAWYNAFRRHADGLKNPATGQCDGISAAYDIDAVPAFLPRSQQKSLAVQANEISKAAH